MAGATKPTLSSSKATKSLRNSILQQRGSIHQNFQKLKAKYEYNHAGNLPQSMTSIETNRDHWNEKLQRLQFNHLPLLRQQINNLPKLLAPAELQNEDQKKLNFNQIKITTF
ncbi:hypothetical protein PCANC_00879 [Puccinia coronata f. sp. avenae]|uniref:Uncharacterized protein n=1 Tax=Puccinia coronata f. sp. avenae TaxID=200324 RepID=A0A2N5W7L3_9BASI|nr:hypothetical protein PCANC_00879 [Puccinia coronata f. sp. avenae]